MTLAQHLLNQHNWFDTLFFRTCALGGGRQKIVKLIFDLALLVANVKQGSHGHAKSWKTIENKEIKSRPGKFIEN